MHVVCVGGEYGGTNSAWWARIGFDEISRSWTDSWKVSVYLAVRGEKGKQKD